MTQVVIDNEIAAMIRRLLGPVEVSEASLAADSVARIGPGGSFLGLKETARRIHAGEQLRPIVSDRQAHEVWRAAGRTALDFARVRLHELLDRHERRGPWAEPVTAAAVRAVCGTGDAEEG